MEIITKINEDKIILLIIKMFIKITISYYNRDNYEKIYKEQQVNINHKS